MIDQDTEVSERAWLVGAGALGRAQAFVHAPERDASDERQRTSDPVMIAFVVAGVILGGYLISLFVRPNGSSNEWLDGFGQATFELLAGLAIFARALSAQRYRRFGLLLGTGACFWAAGDFAMTVETLHGASAPAVSTANFLWAGFYPFAYVAVMSLMRQEVKKLRLASYLDGVMAALVASALFAAFAFHATEAAAGGDTASTAINLVYPIGDVLLFAIVLTGVLLLPANRRRPWYLMGAACIVNTSGDISALFPGLLATRFGYVDNAVAWPISLYLFAMSVWLWSRRPKTEPEEIKPGFILSSIAAGSALLIVFVASVGHVDRGALGLATAALVTAGIRFGLSLAHLRALTEERHRQLLDAARVATEFSARVADGASQQSAALGETTRTVNEIRDAASDTARKAGTVAERARDSVRVGDEGAHAVARIAEAMEEIRDRVGNTANDILALSERTQQIGDITRTVKQLAERSKLLALNASIEAARAGEHGRGFGVVADEVRSLSERSDEATAQVEKVLGEIRDATSSAVIASNEGTKVVEQGLTLTTLAGEVIRSLSETIRDASRAAEEIAVSAEQESVAVEQIAVSVSHVNEAARDLTQLSGKLATLGATA